MSEWISVKKELPLKSAKYLCHTIFPIAHGDFQARVMDVRFDVHTKAWVCKDVIVTHWQDLPELPEVF